jgi:hypothetical protein
VTVTHLPFINYANDFDPCAPVDGPWSRVRPLKMALAHAPQSGRSRRIQIIGRWRFGSEYVFLAGVCVFTSGNLRLLTGAAKSVSERTVGATGGGMAALRWLRFPPSPSLYFSCRCTWRLYIACLAALVCPSAGGRFSCVSPPVFIIFPSLGIKSPRWDLMVPVLIGDPYEKSRDNRPITPWSGQVGSRSTNGVFLF